MEPRTKRIFKFIFVTLFVDLLAFTLILPLMPKILDYYADNDSSGTYKLFNENVKVIQNLIGVPESHNKVLLAGFIGSWFSLLQFASSPFLGAISDRFGRKPILLMAMSGTVVSYSVWLIASGSFALFILSRTIGGLCKANVGLSLAIVSDVSNEESRGKGMALVGSSFSLAFIFGPLFGAYLSTLVGSSQTQTELITNPALIAILLSVINVGLVIFILEETNLKKQKLKRIISNPKVKTHAQSICEESLFTRAFHYVNPKSLFSFSLVKQKSQEEAFILQRTGTIYFYYLLFYSGLEFTLSFLTHLRFGFTSMEQGKLYLFSGLIMAIIQGGYIRRMKGGKEPLMASIGLTLIIPSFILMGLSNSVAQIHYALALYSFSSAVVVPCLTTIISSHSPLESKGAIMGTFRSIGALARAIGPCLASLMFWSFGSKFCYIGGAMALIVPLYMMKNLYSKLSNLPSNHIVTRKRNVVFSEEVIAKAN